ALRAHPLRRGPRARGGSPRSRRLERSQSRLRQDQRQPEAVPNRLDRFRKEILSNLTCRHRDQPRDLYSFATSTGQDLVMALRTVARSHDTHRLSNEVSLRATDRSKRPCKEIATLCSRCTWHIDCKVMRA